MSFRSVSTPLWPLAVAALAAAAPPARSADTVTVSVVAILATTKNSTVDSRVESIAEEVKKKDPKLTGFKLSRMTCKDVEVGSKDCFEVVDGETVCVKVEKR